MVVFEIKFAQISVRMGFRNAVELAVYATLHNGEKRFNRVGVHKATMPHVLVELWFTVGVVTLSKV